MSLRGTRPCGTRPEVGELVVRDDPEGLGDAPAQLGRGLFPALRDDDPPELDLEDEAVGAGRAFVEMPGDGPPPPDGQLAVEVLVDPV